MGWCAPSLWSDGPLGTTRSRPGRVVQTVVAVLTAGSPVPAVKCPPMVPSGQVARSRQSSRLVVRLEGTHTPAGASCQSIASNSEGADFAGRSWPRSSCFSQRPIDLPWADGQCDGINPPPVIVSR